MGQKVNPHGLRVGVIKDWDSRWYAANAENNHQMDPEKLYVSETFATPGPIIKRMMPRAQGRGYRINKRTSHITIAVAER